MSFDYKVYKRRFPTGYQIANRLIDNIDMKTEYVDKSTQTFHEVCLHILGVGSWCYTWVALILKKENVSIYIYIYIYIYIGMLERF